MVKHVKPSAPKGWRRVVPSPEPLDIVEAEVVVTLLANGVLVVASGGGGIPVSRQNGTGLVGVNAVIDKDKAGFTLAQAVGADGLLILTDVDRVALDFGKPGQRFVDRLTAAEAERYLAEGQFLKGSMGPKVEACTRFVRWSGKPAFIGSLERAAEILEGKSGTRSSPGRAPVRREPAAPRAGPPARQARPCVAARLPAGTTSRHRQSPRLLVPRTTTRSMRSAAEEPGPGCWPRLTRSTSWPTPAADPEWRSSLSSPIPHDTRPGSGRTPA